MLQGSILDNDKEKCEENAVRLESILDYKKAHDEGWRDLYDELF